MTDTEVPAAKSLLEANLRRVDQGISMHAVLRDRASRRGTAFTLSTLIASAVSTSLAFADNGDDFQIFGIQAATATWLAIFAIIIFAVSLVDLVLNERGQARRHATAVGILSLLKLEMRRALADHATLAPADFERLDHRYKDVMDGNPAIPDAQFLRLKAWHLRKVELSKLLSEYPGESVRRAKRRLRRRNTSPSQAKSSERR